MMFPKSLSKAILAGTLALFTSPLLADLIFISPASIYDTIFSNPFGSVGGVGFRNEDILVYDTDTGSWAMHFDGSDVGLSLNDINAFHIQDDDSILLSLRSAQNLPGVGFVSSSDIVRFIPTSLGNTTAGSWAWYFDGSDVGLSGFGGDIDAIGFTPDARLVISTSGWFYAGGLFGNDEDLFVFNATSLGANTSGSWAWYFDGSDVALSASDEDIWGVWIDANTDEIYLTTKGSFSTSIAGGPNGSQEDIFICAPNSLGPNTNCTLSFFWDGSAAGLSQTRIDGLFIENNQPPVAQDDAFSTDEDTPVSGDVLANNGNGPDTDPDNNPLSITEINATPFTSGVAFALPSGAMLTMNTDGSFDYDPNGAFDDLTPGEQDQDTFSYTLDDNNGGTDTATVTITIDGVNDPPTANPDSLTVAEGGTQTSLDGGATSVRTNDSDPDNPLTDLTVTTPQSSDPSHANVLTLNADGSFSYTHNGTENFSDSFDYEICDPEPLCATTTVSITITPVNDDPELAFPTAGPVIYDPVVAQPVILDSMATVTDVDSPDFDTGVLSAEITTACDDLDQVTVQDSGIPNTGINVSGNNVSFNGVQIGSFVQGSGCANPPALSVTLNANATLAAVEALLQALAFSTSSADTTQRTVSVTVTDGDGGTSNTVTRDVILDAAPAVTLAEAEKSDVFGDLATPPNEQDIDIDSDLRITFSEGVAVTGNWAEVNCTVSGVQDINAGLTVTDADPIYTLNPGTDFANGETCTLTVFEMQIEDDDMIDPPDNMAADFVINFSTIDTPPQVTSAQVEQGNTFGAATTVIDNNTDIQFVFTEAVDFAANAFTVNCTTGGDVSGDYSASATPSNTVTLTYSGAGLPLGDTCTVTLESTLITDNDAIDPPNQLDGDSSDDIIEDDADDFSFNFTVDNAITVSGTTPVNNTSGIAINSNVVINFNEAPTLNGSWFTIACNVSNVSTANAVITPAGNQVTIDPNSDFLNGEQCTVTLLSSATDGVTDADAGDPPDLLDGNNDGTTGDNHVFTFQTIDLAPTVNNAQVEVADVLTNAPTGNVDADTTIVVNFSESVTASPGAFTVDSCTTSGDVSAQFSVGGLPGTTATLTNGGTNLFPGETCTLTVVAANISDNDGVPPANMAANFTTTFTIDSVLQITSVTVDTETAADQEADNGGSGPIDVNPNTGIDAVFSEAADGTGSWLTITCDATNVAFAPTVFDAQSTVTVTPALEPGESCTLTYVSTLITDDDASDPPDNLDGDENGQEGGDEIVTFGVRPDAVADTYNDIHTNVGINVPAANGALNNDDLGDASPATLVGWGTTAPAAQANTVAPGVQGPTAQGGLATVNADGSFVYDPPPGFTGPTDMFFYHISNANGDHVGQVNLNVAGSTIWFIDSSAGGANRGTLQNPFTSLGSFNGSANTGTGDFVHIEETGTDYGGGLTLKNMMTVIGEGASGSLPTYVASLGSISTFSPTLPTLGGTDPVIVNNGGNGITLAATNTIRGVTVGNTSGAGISGSGAGTLTVAESSIRGTGVGIDVSDKALVVALERLSSSNNTDIDLQNVSGDFDVAANANNIINAGANIAVTIDGNSTVDLGVTLTSVSVNGAASGIVLIDTTGTSGGFTVTGDGSNTRNDSGGVIQNTTSHGIVLTDANSVTLRSIRIDTINTAGTHGIASSGGSNFTFSALTVQNINGGLNVVRSSGWRGTNLGGVNLVNNDCLFTNFGANADGAIDLRNSTANMTSITIDDCNFTNQNQNNGRTVVFFESSGSVNMGTVTVQNGSEFSNLRGMALQTSSLDTSTFTTVIDNNIFRNANPAGLGGINGVAVSSSQSSNHTATISDNDFDDVQIAGGNAGTLSVAVFNTTNSLNADIDSGNAFVDLDSDGDVVTNAQAIRAVSEQTGGGAADVVIDNNVLDDIGRQSIFVSTRNQAPDVDVQISNNDIGQITAVGFTNRDAIAASAEDDANLDTLIIGNDVTGTLTSQEVLNLFTDRVSGGNTPVLNATIGGAGALANTFNNANGGGDDNTVIETLDAGETICVDMTDNTISGVNTIDLTHNGGTFNVTQTSEANMEAVNGGANVIPSGTVNFNQGACPQPTF